MWRAFMAAVLALAIGNPICCCALAGKASDPDPPARSCCRQATAEPAGLPPADQDSAPGAPLPCRCGADDRALLADQPIRLAPPAGQFLPVPALAGGMPSVPGGNRGAVSLAVHDPPGAVEPGAALCIRYCVFRC